jgi:ubiquinone/menaquinone biosynthesis C-methylase UbiE
LLSRMAAQVSTGRLAGVDLSTEMVAHCARRFRPLVEAGKLTLRQASAEALPFEDETFTKACTVNAIFYFPDPAQALAELWRVLAPGGLAAICYTIKEDLADRPFAGHGLKLFEAGEVAARMEAAGFRDLRQHPGEDRHRRFICAVGKK